MSAINATGMLLENSNKNKLLGNKMMLIVLVELYDWNFIIQWKYVNMYSIGVTRMG